MSNLIRDLKTLFQEWLYYKTEDENNFHTYISDKSYYTNGVLNHTYDDSSNQILHLNFIGEYDTNNGYYVGSFKGSISPYTGSSNPQVLRLDGNNSQIIYPLSNGYVHMPNVKFYPLELDDVFKAKITVNSTGDYSGVTGYYNFTTGEVEYS